MPWLGAVLARILDYLEGDVSDSIASLVSELSDDVVRLSQSYAAWYFLIHPEERAPYGTVIERYGEFFESTAVAHFLVVVVTTYQLTDKRSNVLSIPRVLDAAQSVYPTTVEEISARLLPSREIFERIASLRHKVYAHRDGSIGQEMIFREVELTPELIGSCVGLLQQVVDTLSACCVPGSKAGSVLLRATHASDRTQANLQTMLTALAQ